MTNPAQRQRSSARADASAPTRAELLDWVERVAMLFHNDSGLPPITGRIFGWLMVCDPPEQSGAAIAAAIGASRASITTNVRVLTAAGLVRRLTRPGDRTAYYVIDEDAWEQVVTRRNAALAAFVEITADGIDLLGERRRTGKPRAICPRGPRVVRGRVRQRSPGPADATEPPMTTAIHTEQLTKRYGDTLALDALELSVREGEVYGYLGPNGAGKTTTIRLLLGLHRPSSGRAELLGEDPWRDPVEAHRRLAYVAGEPFLWPALTAGETLEFLARLHGGTDVGYRELLVERFQLDTRKKVRALSKGNRQKVQLVAALATRAPLLILDEPTSGLDPLMEVVFRESIEEARNAGRPCSSHPHAQRGRGAVRSRRHPSPRPARRSGHACPSCGTCSAQTVEVTFSDRAPELAPMAGVHVESAGPKRAALRGLRRDRTTARRARAPSGRDARPVASRRSRRSSCITTTAPMGASAADLARHRLSASRGAGRTAAVALAQARVPRLADPDDLVRVPVRRRRVHPAGRVSPRISDDLREDRVRARIR